MLSLGPRHRQMSECFQVRNSARPKPALTARGGGGGQKSRFSAAPARRYASVASELSVQQGRRPWRSCRWGGARGPLRAAAPRGKETAARSAPMPTASELLAPRRSRRRLCVLGWSSSWRVIITAAVCRQARRQSWLRDAEERNLRGTRGCARRGQGGGAATLYESKDGRITPRPRQLQPALKKKGHRKKTGLFSVTSSSWYPGLRAGATGALLLDDRERRRSSLTFSEDVADHPVNAK